MVVVRLVSYTVDGPRVVAAAAKQTIKGRPVFPDELDDVEVEVWIRELWRRQHWSPLEFSWYVFHVSGCSRVCTHQLVRHRIASYAQLSMRYSTGYIRSMVEEACRIVGVECERLKLKSKDEYIIAADVLSKLLEVGDKEDVVAVASIGFVVPPHAAAHEKYSVSINYVKATIEYLRLLASGTRKEDARFVLPSAIKTMIYVGMNARELVTSFLPLRMCTKAQWEIRTVAWKIYNILVDVHPEIFRYAGPRCVLAENTVRERPAPINELLSNGFSIPRCPELVPKHGIPNCLKHAMSVVDNSRGVTIGLERSK